MAISPVVFPARRWFEFQMSASSWQGTSAAGLDLIAAGVFLLQHTTLGAATTVTNGHSDTAAGAPEAWQPLLSAFANHSGDINCLLCCFSSERSHSFPRKSPTAGPPDS